MARHAALSSLFGDDPFFSQGTLLWPFSSLGQDLLGRKVHLADDFFFKDGPSLVNLPLMASAFNRRSSEDKAEDESRQTAVSERPSQAQQAPATHDDLLVTLDARGYAPGDITVKLEGRSLLVAATKQAGAQEAHSCASSSSRASFACSSSASVGFKQKIELSPHLDLAGLSCSLMDDGQLRIHAPVAKQPITEECREPPQEEHKEPLQEEQRMPLEQEEEPPRFTTSLEFPITKENTD
uniref:heat shock protein beta-9 n=1 Tax=Doryrhamphus excisus TaxID=161450 RepID=UPI0025AE0F78|nr:heat shock protein beta-9 [Doryrhamphus excisus]